MTTEKEFETPSRSSKFATVMGPGKNWVAVFFQNTFGFICTYRWTRSTNKWDFFQIAPLAVKDTPIAAIAWNTGEILLYYITAEYSGTTIVELNFDFRKPTNNQTGPLFEHHVAVDPNTMLSAIYWGNFANRNIRLYFQTPGNSKVQEWCGAGEKWVKGSVLPGSPALGTNLSFTHTTEGGRIIRGFWQNTDGAIEMVNWKAGWRMGDLKPIPAPNNSNFAATVVAYKGGYKILLFRLDSVLKKTEWNSTINGWKPEEDVDKFINDPDVKLTSVAAYHFDHDIDDDDIFVFSTGQEDIEERTFINKAWSVPTPIRAEPYVPV